MQKEARVKNRHWKEVERARRETIAKNKHWKEDMNVQGKKHETSVEKKMTERAALLHTLSLT
jgi:hypothetical protein